MTNQEAALKISVVMPAYCAAHYLVKSLPPLIALRDQGLIEDVIVVDDASPDDSTVKTARDFGATVIKADSNGGPGAARNLAAQTASSDLLWFVDADVVVHPESVHCIAGAFEDKQVHALFGCYDDNPPARGFASQYKNLMHRYYHARAERLASTFWSGCGVVRREKFLGLGGFDTKQFQKPSVEDIELGYRIRSAGGLIVLDRNFLCTHLKAWSLKEVVMTDVLKRAAPWSKLLATRPKMDKDLNISNEERFRAGLAGLWALSIMVLCTGLFWAVTPFITAFLTLAIMASSLELFSYFVRRRGILFGFTAIAFHQIYYIYSTITFCFVTLQHKFMPQQSINA